MFFQFIHQNCEIVVCFDICRHEKSFCVGSMLCVGVVDRLELGINDVTSHAFDDGLTCTSIPLGGFQVHKENSIHFTLDNFKTFVTCSSTSYRLEMKFIHNLALNWAAISIGNCNFVSVVKGTIDASPIFRLDIVFKSLLAS
jgi:hypothetical protein